MRLPRCASSSTLNRKESTSSRRSLSSQQKRGWRLTNDFKDIETKSQDVGRLVSKITAGTNEQAQGVDQVNTAVAKTDKVTQQSAANVEESTSAALELSAQAKQLNDMVDDPTNMVRGGVAGWNPQVDSRHTPSRRTIRPNRGRQKMLVSPAASIAKKVVALRFCGHEIMHCSVHT